MNRIAVRPLTDATAGEEVVVVEVDDRDPALLRYLGERGLFPGTRTEVVNVEPFGGSITLRVFEREFPLGRDAAASVRVAR